MRTLAYLSGMLSALTGTQALCLMLLPWIWPYLGHDDPDSVWITFATKIGGKPTVLLLLQVFCLLTIMGFNYLLHEKIFRTGVPEIHRIFAAALLLQAMLVYAGRLPEVFMPLLGSLGWGTGCLLLLVFSILTNLLTVRLLRADTQV